MKPNPVAPFGALLQRHRLAAGLSQEALAERARISVAAVAALERGRRTSPRPDTVALLAGALQLTATDRAALFAAAMARESGAAHVRPRPRAAAPRAEELPPALPAPPTSLIGREHEAATVATLLCRPGSSRMVTLLGPGGVGKTRLALAVAQDLQDQYAGGALFVDLSALHDPDLVAPTVAEALGLRESGAQSARDLLLTHVRDKQLLLVLDTFERVIGAAALVTDLLCSAPGIAVLVTSRAALRVRAEQQYWVPPLPTPPPAETPAPAFAGYAALRLFATRAQAVQPTFTIDADNVGTVAEICRRLDGVPLAIELAAARVALLSPAALLARLEPRLRVLKGGARDLPERQQAIRATIDWSYGLLSTWEQALLRRLSVFVGGFTLQAAEAVTLLGAAADGDVLTGLDALIDHSMLWNTGQQEGEPRFRMLETVREYGREQLAANGEDAAVHRLHAAYYLALAEAANPRLFGAEQMRWLDTLEREHDNLRDILARAHEQRDVALGLRLTGALWRFWYIRCHLGEARRWLQAFAALPARRSMPPALQAEALLGICVIAYAQTDYDQAAVAAEECAALARTLTDGPNFLVALNILGGVARYRSDFARAAALGEECVALARDRGDRWTLALSLNNLAEVARFQGAYERAGALAEESLALARARRPLGHRRGAPDASAHRLRSRGRARGAGAARGEPGYRARAGTYARHRVRPRRARPRGADQGRLPPRRRAVRGERGVAAAPWRQDPRGAYPDRAGARTPCAERRGAGDGVAQGESGALPGGGQQAWSGREPGGAGRRDRAVPRPGSAGRAVARHGGKPAGSDRRAPGAGCARGPRPHRGRPPRRPRGSRLRGGVGGRRAAAARAIDR